MREAALLLAGFAASWLGFALLASSQTQHRKAIAVTRPPSSRQRMIQRGRGLLLLFALVPTYLRDGPSFGVVLWLLLLSLSAMTVALMLAWRAGMVVADRANELGDKTTDACIDRELPDMRYRRQDGWRFPC